MKNFAPPPRKFSRAALFAAAALSASSSLAAAHSFTATINYEGDAAKDVPAALRISTSLIQGFSYNDTNAGKDFEILDQHGSLLPYEIDTWNTEGESLIWVKIPDFANGAKLTVTYGRETDDMSVHAAKVWSGYVGVWHMNGIDADKDNVVRKTPNATPTPDLDGDVSTTSTLSETGRFGKSILVNNLDSHPESGSEKGGVFIPDTVDGGPLDLGGKFAISGWFKGNGAKFRYDILFCKRPHPEHGNAANNGDTSGFGVRLYGKSVTSTTQLQTYGSGGGNKATIAPDFAAGGSDWRHFAVRYNGNYAYVSVDGGAETSMTAGTVTDNNQPLAIGNASSAYRDGNGDRSFLGFADEVRLMAGAPSDAYRKAEYAAMAGAGVFVCGEATAVADAEIAPGDAYHKFTVTVKYEGDAAENVPTLLRLSESGVSGFRYSDFINSGRDLEITDENGNTLPYEIDTWNPDGESLVWVKVPSFADGATLTVSYGRSTSDGTAGAANVWSGYTGVWHMNGIDMLASDFGSYPNSTGVAGLYGEKAKRSTAYEAGAIGGAVRITGNSTSDYTTGSEDRKRLCHGGVFVRDSGEAGPLDVLETGAITLSGWFKHTGEAPYETAYNYDRFFFKRQAASAAEVGGYALQLASYNGTKVQVFGSAANQSAKTSEELGDITKWTHVVFAYGDDNMCRVYANGAFLSALGLDTTTTGKAITDNDEILAIGNGSAGVGDGVGERSWNGWIDEVRVTAREAKSAAYIAAEYAAMADAGALEYGEVKEVANDTTTPQFAGAPSVAWDAERKNMVFTVTVTGGKGTILAEYARGDGAAAVSETIATLDGNETFPFVVSAEVPSTLAADAMYSFAAVAKNSGGTQESRASGNAPFYFGKLAVAKGADAYEETMSSGTFRISRDGTDAATAYALDVAYVLAGDAVERGAVAGPASGVATIPAGAAYVDVAVAPLYNTAVAENLTLSITLAGANFASPSESTAEMTVYNTSADLHVRYVAPGGDDSALGCAADAPKRTIGAAISAVSATAPATPCEIHVAPGVYEVSAELNLQYPIRVLGEGASPSDVVVTNVNGRARIFNVNHADAVVSGLTMAGGGVTTDGGAGFYVGIAGGTVTNCIVENCSLNTERFPAAGGYLMNGLVTHTVFRGLNATKDPGEGKDNLALCLMVSNDSKFNVAGRAENCLVTGISTERAMSLVRVVGNSGATAVVRNLTIAGCEMTYSGAATAPSPLYAEAHSEVRNVVAAGVVDADGNALPFTASAPAQYNNYFNCATDGDASSMPAGTVTGTAEEFFANFGAGNYRPKTGGPLVNAGSSYDGVAGVDLAGKPRVFGSAIDIGAFECTTAGFRIVVR